MEIYIIEKRKGLSNYWQKYKQFKSLKEAKQNLKILKNNKSSLFKNNGNVEYRIYDTLSKIYYT